MSETVTLTIHPPVPIIYIFFMLYQPNNPSRIVSNVSHSSSVQFESLASVFCVMIDDFMIKISEEVS